MHTPHPNGNFCCTCTWCLLVLQAEYADPATLEARLQAVARRCFIKTPNGATRAADGMQQQQEATSGLAPNNQFVDGQQQGGQLHQMQQQQSGGLMHNNLLSSMSNPMNSSPLLNGTAGASMLGREGPLLGQVPGSQQYAGSQSQQQQQQQQQQQYMQQQQQQYRQQHQQHQQQLQQQQQQMNSQYSMHQMANGAAHGLRGSSMMPNGVPAMVKGARDGQSPYLNVSDEPAVVVVVVVVVVVACCTSAFVVLVCILACSCCG